MVYPHQIYYWREEALSTKFVVKRIKRALGVRGSSADAVGSIGKMANFVMSLIFRDLARLLSDCLKFARTMIPGLETDPLAWMQSVHLSSRKMRYPLHIND